MLHITTPFAAWLLVLLSGFLEVLFSVSMKMSDGFSRPLPAVISVASAVSSVWLMAQTLKVLPLGTAYAVWAGLGATGTVAIGILFLGEPANLSRLACICAIVVGIVGLQLQGTA